jgi:hypothetical protein
MLINPPIRFTFPPTGQTNAWDNPPWVEAIEKAGRKTLNHCRSFGQRVHGVPALIIDARRPHYEEIIAGNYFKTKVLMNFMFFRFLNLNQYQTHN